MKKLLPIGVLLLQSLFAQNFQPLNIPISEENGLLLNPFAGGMNQPQFSQTDLNADGLADLFTFDRSGNYVRIYTGDNLGNWKDAPTLRNMFPADLHDWALLRDFDCDGEAEIFTASTGYDGIAVYKIDPLSNPPQYVLEKDFLRADTSKIYVAVTDLPAIRDIDADGDLDILTYDSQGFFLYWYKNMSKEQFGTCDSLTFVLADECWGDYQEDGLSNEVNLNVSCGNGIVERTARHAGFSIETFDYDGDGFMELLLGDVSANNIVYLHNSAEANTALMDAYNYSFPIDEPVDNYHFPAAFLIDANVDGLLDMIVAPSSSTVTGNVDNIDLYQNIGNGTQYDFSFVSGDFLQNTMIDCGSGARPVFFDYNADGLQDLLAGTDNYKFDSQTDYADLTLYENVGTATSPAYQLVSRQWLGLNTIFQNPQIYNVHPTFGDLDGDGSQDLLIGNSEGQLHWFKNHASAGMPADFQLEEMNYAGIDVGASSTPQLVDLNRDGLLDIVCGRQEGKIFYFQNTGTASLPQFSSTPTDNFLGDIDADVVCCTGFSVPFVFDVNGVYEMLVGTERGDLLHYNNIDNNLSGSFNLLHANLGGIEEGSHISVSVSDINQDGYRDYAIGNTRGGLSIWSDMPTAIELDFTQESFFLYPNPAKTSLLVAKKGVDIPELFNLNGQKIQAQRIENADTWEYEISALAKGIYLCRVGEKVIKWAKE